VACEKLKNVILIPIIYILEYRRSELPCAAIKERPIRSERNY